MSQTSFSWELFKKAPVVGVVRNLSLEEVSSILPLYHKSGLTTIEITMNTPGAEEIIRYALEHFHDRLNIGAGTVVTKNDLDIALSAGARFIVTPVVEKKIIRACVKKGVPVFPGAFTPSEIYKAWSWGAAMVKIFPATSLGPEYIKDIKAPLNMLKLLPTGGVSLENMVDFLAAGAEGLGIGSQLFDKNLVKEKNWEGLHKHFQEFVNRLGAAQLK